MVAILVAFTFLGLILADFGVQKWSAWQEARSAERAMHPEVAPSEILWDVPGDVHLSDFHAWLRADPRGGIEIGADNLIVRSLGAATSVSLPQPGTRIAAGEPLFRLEKDGGALTVPSAVTGVVGSVNTDLLKAPSLINSDPYGKGWICRMIPTEVDTSMPRTRCGEKAILWLESEFSRLRNFLSVWMPLEPALGATSQDGGLPVPGSLAQLPKTVWKEFEAEFLKAVK